jgi:ABC-type multidrug transport system permease subunit
VKSSDGAGPIDRGGTWPPLIELTVARLREFVREPEALFWTFVFPMIMSIALAVAFPGGAGKPALVAIEPGEGRAAIRQALAAAPGITIRDLPPGDEDRALREGEVHLLIVPTSPPAYRFDAARNESRIARLLVDDALKRAAGRIDPFTARDEPVQVAGSRYVDWLIPGIVGMNIMGTSMWGIGFTIVTARGRKLLKRLAASPMRRHEYLLAQIGGRLVFLAPEAGVPLAFGALVLGLPIRGSIAAISIVSLVGALAFGGIGLLLASRVRTFEAISGLMNLAMVPMWVVSGIFFSSSNFPQALQPVIQALPLTALINALRAVVLEGAGVAGVARELAVLTAWGAASFGIALGMFRWR